MRESELSAKFDLHLIGGGVVTTMRVLRLGWPVSLTYATDLFDESTVAGFAEQFVRVLETISAKPNVVVGDIVVLGEAERALVLESGCGEVRAGVSGTLVDLFDGQVVRGADRLRWCVVVSSCRMREFDARVNRFARYLISVGVGPESLVALAMRRSVDLVVGMYAVCQGWWRVCSGGSGSAGGSYGVHSRGRRSGVCGQYL